MRGAGSRFAPTAAFLILCFSLTLNACSNASLTQPSWPAPADPMGLARKAGFEPTDREFLITHTHDHLDVFVDGKHVPVPAGIGIDTKSPGVEEQPTSDGTGKDYQVDDQCVGEFCSSNTQIAVYVNGQKVSGNPADIELKTHLEIAVVIGKPPDQIPSSWDFLEGQP
jgi:hypothetical protein